MGTHNRRRLTFQYSRGLFVTGPLADGESLVAWMVFVGENVCIELVPIDYETDPEGIN